MNNKKAVIIGATGLVGKALVKKCLDSELFGEVVILVRRNSGIKHPKLREHVIDFNDFTEYKTHISGDVLFSCMGTTLKQAGSKKSQYKVDFTYQYQAAVAAKKNNIPTYVLVSSTGADSSSRFYYLRMKGELEDAVKKLEFNSTIILQPSLLTGDREKNRTGERIGATLYKTVIKIIPKLKKYKPIAGEEVAEAMIIAAKNAQKGTVVLKSQQISASIGHSKSSNYDTR